MKTFLNEIMQSYNTLSLDLTGLSLTYLVDEIYEIKGLTRLKLLHNELHELPETIGNLEHLVNLNLCDNKLAWLPDSFSRLQALEVLKLSYNHLEEVPEDLVRLPRLEQLWLSHNMLEALPYELYKLTSLSELLCTANPILELPQGLMRLTKIKKLAIEVYDLTILTKLRFIMDEMESLRIPPRTITMNGQLVVLNYIKRIHAARQTGNLVLDKLGLKSIPVEVFLLTSLTPSSQVAGEDEGAGVAQEFELRAEL